MVRYFNAKDYARITFNFSISCLLPLLHFFLLPPLIFFIFLFQGPLSKDPLPMNTYVALYKFVPQENEDLEMR